MAIVEAPTCADVATGDLLLALDVDGDCEIGLSDFVLLFFTDVDESYLDCNDPLEATCDWPF